MKSSAFPADTRADRKAQLARPVSFDSTATLAQLNRTILTVRAAWPVAATAAGPRRRAGPRRTGATAAPAAPRPSARGPPRSPPTSQPSTNNPAEPFQPGARKSRPLPGHLGQASDRYRRKGRRNTTEKILTCLVNVADPSRLDAVEHYASAGAAGMSRSHSTSTSSPPTLLVSQASLTSSTCRVCPGSCFRWARSVASSGRPLMRRSSRLRIRLSRSSRPPRSDPYSTRVHKADPFIKAGRKRA